LVIGWLIDFHIKRWKGIFFLEFWYFLHRCQRKARCLERGSVLQCGFIVYVITRHSMLSCFEKKIGSWSKMTCLLWNLKMYTLFTRSWQWSPFWASNPGGTLLACGDTF
jgi:hypothetical protein